MVWKMAKIECIMGDTMKVEKLEEVKPKISVKDKAAVAFDGPQNVSPKPTPNKRYYNRRSPSNFSQRRTMKGHGSPLVVLDDNDDGKYGTLPSIGKSKLGNTSTPRPKASTTSLTVQRRAEDTLPKALSINGKSPSITSFRVAFQKRVAGCPTNASTAQHVGRKLTYSHSPNGRPGKLPKVYEDCDELTLKGESSKETSTRSESPSEDLDEVCILPGYVLPLYVDSLFRATADMELTREDVLLSAFIFSPNDPQSEVLLKLGHTEGTRLDFQCLCPGNVVKVEIIRWMSLKTNWLQNRVIEQTVWTLPPEFGIYVPIQEYNGHWYLMVLCLEDQVIYYLDSFMTDETVGHRRDNVMIICNIIIQMMESHYFPTNYVSQVLTGESWDIMHGIGIPNCGHSYNSAIGVLQWLSMEHSYSPNFITVQLNEPAVRMRIALSMVNGCHNQYREAIEAKASEHWSKVLPST